MRQLQTKSKTSEDTVLLWLPKSAMHSVKLPQLPASGQACTKLTAYIQLRGIGFRDLKT
jgi:hypothetical protein